MNAFKDNFSKQAEIYSKFRPTYPKELFVYLKQLTPEHTLAWDCGTGNGQSAVQLAAFYDQVYATDPSAAQIDNAIPDGKITYKIEKAEEPQLGNNSVDLITVAQAIHWFDFDQFYAEVKRVLKPAGIIAVWAYGIPSVEEAINPIIKDFHDNVIGKFWQPENKLIDQEYTIIPFPFKLIEMPAFYIRKPMNLAALCGHFRSWSATQKYIDTYKDNPVAAVAQKLSAHWENPNTEKEVVWKLILKVRKMA